MPVSYLTVVPVYELTLHQTRMEHSQILKLFDKVRKAYRRKMDPEKLPSTFRFGAGHYQFFYTRLMFVNHRQVELIKRLTFYGMPPSLRTEPRVVNQDIPELWWGDYDPTPEALALCRRYLQDGAAFNNPVRF